LTTAEVTLAGQLLISLVFAVIIIVLIYRGDYLNPISDPIAGRLIAFVGAFAQ